MKAKTLSSVYTETIELDVLDESSIIDILSQHDVCYFVEDNKTMIVRYDFEKAIDTIREYDENDEEFLDLCFPDDVTPEMVADELQSILENSGNDFYITIVF